MKLIKRILTLGLGLGLVGGALAGLSARNGAKEAKATDYETYIPMEASFFTDWTDAAGSFADKNATFWGENYHFQALDTFYRGETGEGWTGTLTSRTWKQHTQYIYFQLGGAKNYDVTGDPVHLKIHFGDHFDVFYNDTFVENPLVLRGYKIPDNAYKDLMSSGDDFDMYIEILDQQTADYGFANFGYLHVNQTKQQVNDAMRFYLNNMNLDGREWEVNKRKQILENYYLNGSLKEFFYAPVEDISDDFESNSDFLNHWYFDYHYANGANWGIRFDKAIGHDYARPDDATMMPFNKTDNGFFRGWFENEDLGGFVGGDNSIYRFISRPFVLSGTGLISIKMAGTASLHVIDTETRQDLVWADLLTYSTAGDQVNLATSGFNTVTMVRHVINLEAYVGRNIQLAIADVSDGGWSALYVDELKVNLESNPGFKVDTFAQTNTSGTFNCYRTDKFINSTVFNAESNPTGLKYVLEAEINKANDNAIINTVDNTPAKDAYNFLDSYYSSLRAPENQFDISKASEEVKLGVVGAYKALSKEAKEIVDASTDIQYNGTFEEEWWVNSVDTSKTVSTAIHALVDQYTKYTVSFDSNGGSGEMEALEVKGEYELPESTFVAPEEKHFVGWKVNGEGETLAVGETIEVSEDTVLVAQWANNVYTVSFDGNGGSGSMGSVDKEYGSLYILPGCDFVAPAGQQFAGWKLSNDETLRQPGYELTVTGNVTVKAIWEDIPSVYYTVSFDSNGGSGLMQSVEKGEGTTYYLPENDFTAPLGKKFAGWAVNSADATPLLQPGDPITVNDNTVVYAVWEDVILTGTVNITGTLKFGETLTATVEDSNNSGELAYQWKRNGGAIAEATSKTYTLVKEDVGSSLSCLVTSSVEAGSIESAATALVAKADAPKAPEGLSSTDCTNKANNDGTISGVSSLMEYRAENETSWTACEGSVVEGLANGTYYVRLAETETHEAGLATQVVIKAYVPAVYSVSFKANGGSGEMESVSLEEGSLYALPACGFTAPEGQRFIGWKIDEEETLRQPGYELTVNNDVEVTAMWEVIPPTIYTVSFDANGGSGEMTSVDKEGGSTYVLPECGFTAPEGKEFAGWKVGNDASIKQPGAEITINGNVTIVAQWKVIPVVNYLVTFDANGGSGTMNAVMVQKGQEFTLPACTFVAPKNGTFEGWLVGETLHQVGDVLVINEDTVVKASWKVTEDKPAEEPDDEKEDDKQDENESVFMKFIKRILDFFKKFVDKLLQLFGGSSK